MASSNTYNTSNDFLITANDDQKEQTIHCRLVYDMFEKSEAI